jgi:heat shock protein HslJ
LVAPAFVVVAVLAGGCGSPEPPPPAPGGPPTIEELRNATYTGLGAVSRSVTLTEGAWEGEAPRVTIAMARDDVVAGDLDGEPPDEAVVVLSESAGGAGANTYLAVVRRRGTDLVNVATAPLGAHVALRQLRIERRVIVADVVRPGPDDEMCCPGDLATRAWAFSGPTLLEIPLDGPRERLSLATLGDQPWILRSWTLDETAPTQPRVTLAYQDGRLAGSAGCNTYTAAVTAGDAPGGIAVGPVVATRRMCPEPEMQVEGRYLQQLGAATRYGFLLAQLALTYEWDGQMQTMLFSRD